MPGKRKITQQKPGFGNNRPFSLKATHRKFRLNMQTKRMYVPKTERFVTLQVTTSEIRTIDKIGLPEFLKRQGSSLKGLL
jgi:large subunit ribosomal protein L28